MRVWCCLWPSPYHPVLLYHGHTHAHSLLILNNNTAGYRAGGFEVDGSSIVSIGPNSQLRYNEAGVDGGAFHVHGTYDNGTKILMAVYTHPYKHIQIHVHSELASLTIGDTLLLDSNVAGAGGGAFAVEGSGARVVLGSFSTITNNRATTGGAIISTLGGSVSIGS